MTNPLDQPDTVEWSVRWADGRVDSRRYTEAGARHYAADLGAEVVTRHVGQWTPADGTPVEADR